MNWDRPEEIFTTSSSATSTTTAPGSSDRTMSTARRDGQHGGAVLGAGHGHLGLDGQVPVDPDQAQHVTIEPQLDPGQRRGAGSPRGHRPARGAEGLDQHVAFASELHGGAISSICVSS